MLAAHEGLEREAGALRSAASTCGTCHPDETRRVEGSLMASARGLIAIDRWGFGELSDDALAGDGHGHYGHDETMLDLLGAESPSPGQDHARRLCAGCHLNSVRDNRDDAVRGTGSGCGACHVSYEPAPRATRIIGNRLAPQGFTHPGIDGVVSDQRCLGCHSRSSRISLSYQGLAEISGSFLEECEEPAEIFDGRSGCRLPADVHFEAGMTCTDCHLHTELMGDGRRYDRERDAVELRCESCHGAPGGERPSARWREIADPITRRILARRGVEAAAEEEVLVGARGTPIWNTHRRADGRWEMRSKDGERRWTLTPTPGDVTHRQAGHEDLSCQACHSSWAPTCPTCHTEYDATQRQWDFASGTYRDGRWVETNEGMGFGMPGIGRVPRRQGEGAEYVPEVPGMDAVIDARGAGGELREIHRRAHFDPHTTRRVTRGCDTCHEGPVSAGVTPLFGDGTEAP